jgi:hypothetical protein
MENVRNIIKKFACYGNLKFVKPDFTCLDKCINQQAEIDEIIRKFNENSDKIDALGRISAIVPTIRCREIYGELFSFFISLFNNEKEMDLFENEAKSLVISNVLYIAELMPTKISYFLSDSCFGVIIKYFNETCDFLNFFRFSLLLINLHVSHRIGLVLIGILEPLITSESELLRSISIYLYGLLLGYTPTLFLEVKDEIRTIMLTNVIEETCPDIFSASLLFICNLLYGNVEKSEIFFSTAFFDSIAERFFCIDGINVTSIYRILKLSDLILKSFYESDIVEMFKADINSYSFFVREMFCKILTGIIKTEELELVSSVLYSDEFNELFRLICESDDGKDNSPFKYLIDTIKKLITLSAIRSYSLSKTFIFRRWFIDYIMDSSDGEHQDIKKFINNELNSDDS